ncbi:transmembrane protein, putative (macronuclear) [Tetrahymena thermophila SB210]|uniref:Transmembrane protein, putative n=1 Tax=Tetrahymena thermophila (strain SB210) TaxID=312017 RepID=A4VDU4_TETTS|nr:transmembrane protein, putative [Tetrahymena thermophila SB210]EDK31681.1 transmembrane protein, putative [Tetrahymena thermophila SB210]|eukprot:XP_001470809.1 transmembrane protein, putative [Tetrahymena thermophila SB210]
MRLFLFYLMIICYSNSKPINLTQEDSQNVKNSFVYLNNLSKTDGCAYQLIKDISSDCKQLSEDQKSRLSLKLTNCLLIRSSKRQIVCSDDVQFEICSQELNGDSWNTYSSFYMHIDNICFYYQALNWQKETQQLISNLLDNSDKANLLILEALNNSLQMKNIQNQIHQQMQNQFQLQEEANRSIQENNTNLEKLKKSISTSFEQIVNQILIQSDKVSKVLSDLFEGLNEIKIAQQWITNNFFDLSTFLFYFGFSFLLMLLTSFKKLCQCRTSSLLLLWICFIIERLFLRNDIFFINSSYFQTTFRFILCMLQLFILSITYKSYQDFSRLNYQQIQEIQTKLNMLNSDKIKYKIKSCLLSLTKDMKKYQQQISNPQKKLEFQDENRSFSDFPK